MTLTVWTMPWEQKGILSAHAWKSKKKVFALLCMNCVNTRFPFPSPWSAADAVSGVLREEARRDIKIFSPLFIYGALHLRRIWVDITACKLKTTCVRHWSQKNYSFPIVSVQHFPHTDLCMRPTLVNQFRVNNFSNNYDLVIKPRLVSLLVAVSYAQLNTRI